MMTDVLYVPGMSVNLLSIIALDRRGFIVFFESQRVTITNQRTGSTIMYEYAINGLYKLTNSISDRAFVSNNVRKSNNNGVGLIKAQISKVSRFMKMDNIAKLRDFAELRDIRLKEY